MKKIKTEINLYYITKMENININGNNKNELF